MKTKITLLLFLLTLSLTAQEKIDYSSKVTTIDSTIATLYFVISGNKGEARNWELFKHLFRKDAKLIATGKNEKKQTTLRYMSSEDYIKFSEKWLMDNGFHELEIKRETQTFGNIAHVFSTYEAYNSKDDDTPLMRGINSIQLFNDGKRWWIVNLYWNQESKESPIPEDYLPKSSN
ncbi:hypothetical protein [Winogradskyella thalassocola]|uniref:SnoaL-like domain-containing protein n=1 Tax=Winogradskyella thalassocola TaxID=262004 RepID=A0A1G8ISN7_9FLAO|nr:hypothetical protein [Winogradskyella thalassocola]SDI21974.1 hypothetical protein SAMN04489796_10867 [Winogradskyella thalassocola]